MPRARSGAGNLSHDLRLDEKQEKLEVIKCFFYNELEVRKQKMSEVCKRQEMLSYTFKNAKRK